MIARWWRRDGEAAICELCCHRCRLREAERGACGVRLVRNGELVTAGDGSSLVVRVDPIEKKPLYHVAPGARCLSFGVPGCSFRCRYCQNWIVSQVAPDAVTVPTERATPADLIERAVAAGCRAVAATYTEPTVFAELALEVAARARQAGLLTVWKTNGFIEHAPQAEAAELLDAVNVDLKSFRDDVHQRLCGAPLRPVRQALARWRQFGVWLEVTTLVIPGLTDDAAELLQIAAFIRDELGADTPWHLTRFHPDHQLRHLPPTPAATLHAARDAALNVGLRYVYTDVEPRGRGWDTSCRFCGATLLERAQYALTASHLRTCSGAATSCDGWAGCPRCGAALPGVALPPTLAPGKETAPGAAT